MFYQQVDKQVPKCYNILEYINNLMRRKGFMFKNKKQTLGVILWIAVIAEIVVIFVFSGMDKGMSDKMSSPMSDTAHDFIARHIVTDLDERPKKEQNAFEQKICIFVRKTAHLFEYALLGALFLLRFRLYGTSVFRASMYSSCVCALVAVSDEYHQTFVDGRCGCLEDVLVDFAGIAGGILICVSIVCFIGARKKKKAKKELPAGG